MAWTDRYVTVAGGGDSSGDSWANAWTLAEMVANAASGERVYIEDDTYTLGADLTFPSGANENPITYVGVNSGHTEPARSRGSSGTEQLSNYGDFPIIDGGTYLTTCGAFTNYRNIHFRSARTTQTISMANASAFRHCRIENTHTTGSSAGTVSGGSVYNTLTDCDMVVATNHADCEYVTLSSRSQIAYCRIWNTNATHPGTGINLSPYGSHAHHCIVLHTGNAIEVVTNAQLVANNTIYDCSTGIALLAASGANTITNNIIYSCSGYGIGGTTGGAAIIQNNAMGDLTSGRIDTTGLGSVIEEYDAITLTADPFTSKADGATGDFSLNTTAGGGALCRAASAYVWGGFDDVGAVQHEDSGGGGIVRRLAQNLGSS